jgi:hypothetical protein
MSPAEMRVLADGIGCLAVVGAVIGFVRLIVICFKEDA